MDTITRTPIVWDRSDAGRWLADPLAETQRNRDAMTAQWPADMRMGYLPQSAVLHMVPADQTFGGSITPLCGAEHPYGMVETERVESKPCRTCTERYNEGATTGMKPDPFPFGATVEFDTRLGDKPSVTRGVVVPREWGPQFRNYRVVQINEAMRCEVHIDNLTAVEA